MIENVQEPGLLITNGEFVADDISKSVGDPKDGPVQVLVREGTNHGVWNRGPVRFVNCSFWGPSRQIARLESDITLGFGNCTFCQWNEVNPAIVAEAGNLSVNSCEFRQTGPQISLGPQVNQAAIVGNMAWDKWNIVNDAKRGDVQIGLNSSFVRKNEATAK